MLDVAVERGCLANGGDVMRCDMGAGFGFRPGMFDGAISVSALQWLCYNDRKDHVSARRLETFFTALYRALRRGARAALQFYPENEGQLELVTAVAKRCGFGGGLVVDFPNSTKAKKYYLVLFAGAQEGAAGAAGAGGKGAGAAAAGGARLPRALGVDGRAGVGPAAAGAGAGGDDEDEDGEEYDDDDEEGEGEYEDGDGGAAAAAGAGGGGSSSGVHVEGRRARHKRRERRDGHHASVKSRAWIIAKKEAQLRRDADAATANRKLKSNKYTGRRRGPKF